MPSPLENYLHMLAAAGAPSASGNTLTLSGNTLTLPQQFQPAQQGQSSQDENNYGNVQDYLKSNVEPNAYAQHFVNSNISKMLGGQILLTNATTGQPMQLHDLLDYLSGGASPFQGK